MAKGWYERGVDRRIELTLQRDRQSLCNLQRDRHSNTIEASAPTLASVRVRGQTLAKWLLLLLVLPATVGDLRSERYCLNTLDGVCDEGSSSAFACAVGADEYDCRNGVAAVSTLPLGPGGQPGRAADLDTAQVATTWRSQAAGSQQVVLTLDRPRCVATVHLKWFGPNSPQNFLVSGSLDGVNSIPLVDGTGTAAGYGDRVDDFDLAHHVGSCVAGGHQTKVACEAAGYAWTPGTYGRMRSITATLSSGYGSYYELRDFAFTEDESRCAVCGVTQTTCSACITTGCAWCSSGEGAGTCAADTPAACGNSSLHVGAGTTPATWQQRTCTGACTGLMCDSEVPGYLSVTPAPSPTPPLSNKRGSVPFTCSEFDIALSVSNVTASSSLNPDMGLYLPSKAFDGVHTESTAYQNVWIATEGFPQWLEYDFGQSQALCSYAIYARASAVWMSPRDWDFEGSHDGIVWVTIKEVRGQPPWSSMEKRVFSADVSLFRRYRLRFLAAELVDGTPTLQVALQEVDLMPPLNECVDGEFETAAPTATADRVCSGLIVCHIYNEYETAAPTATTNRNCTALTECIAAGEVGEQYQSAPPSATTDRICTALTVCMGGTYESVEPTASTDRQCTGIPANSMEIHQTYSDGLGVRWTQPTIARVGFALLGFRLYVTELRPTARKCTDVGKCTYTEANAQTGTPQSCAATDGPDGTNVCGAVVLPGLCSVSAATSKTACASASGTWTPAPANQASCEAAGGCTYRAQASIGAVSITELCSATDLAECAAVDFDAPFHDAKYLHLLNDFSSQPGLTQVRALLPACRVPSAFCPG